MFVLKYGLVVFVTLFAVTQIIIPAFTGYPFFWIFKWLKERKSVSAAIDKADSEIIRKEVKNEIVKKRRWNV